MRHGDPPAARGRHPCPGAGFPAAGEQLVRVRFAVRRAAETGEKPGGDVPPLYPAVDVYKRQAPLLFHPAAASLIKFVYETPHGAFPTLLLT